MMVFPIGLGLASDGYGLATFGGGLNDERVLEAYHDGAVAPHLRLGPDVQVIWPGTPGQSTALFLGVRGRVVF